MELRFPPLAGGTVSGLNDAGIETFEGDFEQNIVSECGQNSLDVGASHNTPVELRISRLSLSVDDLPFIPELKNVLKACREYWRTSDSARKFFDTALRSIQGKSIDVLKVSDSGTIGLDGGDHQRDGRWFGLVKSRGVSNQKDAGSGGAFGIGKDAPLAGSAVRTVLYSTRTKSGKVAFQGVCRLVTHEDGDGEETQGTGFIGDYVRKEDSYVAIRKESRIPRLFRRDKPGLDLWILGARHTKDDWERPFIRSALVHFWPALAAGKLRFVIGDHAIDKTNLGRWMRSERSNPEVAEAYQFFRSTVDREAKHFQTRLPHAGHCSLRLLLGPSDLPRCVCLVRATGMVIDSYKPRIGVLPFSGLFVCDDPEGNRLLKSLEPPRHDKWDPSRAKEPKAVEAYKEIRQWIRDEIRNLIPHVDQDQFNETAVPQELMEIEPENPITDREQDSAEPDLSGRARDTSSITRFNPKSVQIRRRSQGGDGAGGEGNEVEEPEPGDGENTGGRKRLKGGRGEGGSEPKRPFVQARAFPVSKHQKDYEIVLRAAADYSGDVWIDAVGDDGTAGEIIIESAKTNGTSLGVERNKIKGAILQRDQPVQVAHHFVPTWKIFLAANIVMIFDRARAWPHPVLSPLTDDVLPNEFDFDLTIESAIE